ncbi:pantoate--beta-alanine ligase [Thiohalomonas denitrificans]|uniref:Pantothenate synthetase n=1 Tax=Thiohalomonas denitrificans TaxID=415747 RepID=A0A1G5Q1G1_9GAMM|nr:pantoate--beta-alanine ligase [Thiohalomonas denitrificans]SCZ55149.1 pantoate--beta-alanine ligase [Thiohalomonas denitrificans]
MQSLNAIADVRRQVADWHRAGERVALVPTMGNLHEGHLVLVDRAREQADRVVVSVFVNPTQFVQGEDFDSYPRTPEEDAELLRRRRADVVFLPEEAEIYPRGREGISFVEVPGISEQLCGASRPGHFRGVATVVMKLFHIVQPDVAIFGEKDFQQLAVLRRMAEDLSMAVELVGVSTVRETDGLAMSSRNRYLSPNERQKAPALYRMLMGLAAHIESGERDIMKLEGEGMARLAEAGFEPEYVSVRRADDLQLPRGDEKDLVLLAAARLGRARLIDNLIVTV